MAWRTSTEALALVKSRCAADVEPTLTDPEIINILNESANATVWAASTTYDYGALVVPTHSTGLVFTPVKRGTTGTTEPEWPIEDRPEGPYDTRRHNTFWNPFVWSRLEDIQFNDGSISWVVVEPDFDDIWNIQQAVYECWLLKAGKVDVVGGQDVTSLQVGDVRKTFTSTGIKSHCLQMADRYRPLQIA